MVASRPSFSRRAFTLIELLVVIAIIGILMSLLLPMLGRIRRQGQVVASPIAYVAMDGRVLLTSGNGYGEVDLKVRSKLECPICHTPPTWSPSGSQIALRSVHKLNAGEPERPYITIVNPMANTTKSILESNDGRRRSFTTWVDSDRFVISERLSAGVSSYNIINRENGATMGWMKPDTKQYTQFLYATPTPVGSDAPFVGATLFNNGAAKRNSVVFFRKNMIPGRPIYIEQGTSGAGDLAFPRIDPFGEYVAWSRRKGGTMSGGTDLRTWRIELIGTRSGSNSKPLIIGMKYFSAAFCDFTEGGDILANVTNDVNLKIWKLVIFDRQGNLIREINPPTPPGPGTVASWRKLGRK